jgi:hypothetical protein
VSLLLADGMRPDELFQPDGELNYGLLAMVSQHVRQQQSKCVRDLMQTVFEHGRHRGHDPFGYESGGRETRIPGACAAAVLRCRRCAQPRAGAGLGEKVLADDRGSRLLLRVPLVCLQVIGSASVATVYRGSS